MVAKKPPTPEEIAQDKAKKAFEAALPAIPGPLAARVTDNHLCPMVTGVVPHVGGPILPTGCLTVLIGGMPAARVTDMLTCAGGPDVIAKGSPTVLIGNLMAARMGDQTAHGGMIVMGCPTVMIGESGSGGADGGGPQGAALRKAAQAGTPFCEICEKLNHGGS
jgi:uncharacterized Zn-binding protein involved in type VI secretion